MTNSSATASASLVEAALGAADAEERRQATSLIADLPVYEALPLLLRALGDEDWRVRKEATYAARAFVPAPALVAAMIRTFEPCDNVGLRNAAIEVLASSGSAATSSLVAALDRLDADGRKLAVQALGLTRDPHALATLERTLRDPDENVRQGSVEAIAQLGPIAPMEVQRLLLRCLKSKDPFAQLAALEGLNSLGVMLPWELLEPLLEHPTLRSAALVAAASSESPEAARAVVQMLPRLRGTSFSQAISALARLSDGPLIVDVASALAFQNAELGARLVELARAEGQETQAHRSAALLLAALANAKGVVDVAVHALEDDMLTEHAERALSLLGPRALPDLLARIVHSGDQTGEGLSGDVRAGLVEVAAQIALSKRPELSAATESALLDALRKAALDEERRVATASLFALSKLGTDADLPLAARLTSSPMRPVAHAAEGALASLASRFPESARSLCDELSLRSGQQQEDTYPAAILIGALAASGVPFAASTTQSDMAFLARAAAAEDVRTRRAAIGAVAEIGGDSAVEVLSLALADEEREVRLAAARALGYLVMGTFRQQLLGKPEAAASLRTIRGLVGRPQDPELLATALRSFGEGVSSLAPEILPRASAELLAQLGPLAREADAVVAIAAVEAIGRLPWGSPGRQAALVAALDHPDDAVVKAAMLKIETSGTEGAELLRCLDHASHDVRLLAAETLAASDNPALREQLAQRTSHEIDRNVRDALEGALSSIRWRGERSVGGS